ncbi:hypothetical protein BV22DRAFT_1037240 [Leucogyrophana mollusca]|uniref:Uncharacterized protein n=1 Tax=Leucogyrophana mollusca TaxID=85980 RepID=A0ACB8BCW4_9AGAM|nr:hypothetical protein BV22DRAFT_1037240 [Leucogyrophana mollusca]
MRTSYLISAWDIVDRKLQRDLLQSEEVEETLSSLIAFTCRFPETNPGSQVTPDVQSVLGKHR